MRIINFRTKRDISHIKLLRESFILILASIPRQSGILYIQTGDEYLNQEDTFLGKPPLNLSYDAYSQYCHDATWTLAYALNKTLASKLLEINIAEKVASRF
jgi:hypothetical protein